MKKAATLVALVMAIALCSVGAQAQAMLKANIPFDFTVGKTHLASGTYLISQAGSEVEIFYNENGKASTMFLTIPMSNLKVDSSRNGRDSVDMEYARMRTNFGWRRLSNRNRL